MKRLNMLICVAATAEAITNIIVKLPSNAAAAEGRVLVYFQRHNDSAPMEYSAARK